MNQEAKKYLVHLQKIIMVETKKEEYILVVPTPTSVQSTALTPALSKEDAAVMGACRSRENVITIEDDDVLLADAAV